MILMGLVLATQLLPNLFMDYFSDDMQWYLYISSLLGQILFLSMLLVANMEIKRTRKLCLREIVAAIIFISSMYQIGSFVFAMQSDSVKVGINVSIENE